MTLTSEQKKDLKVLGKQLREIEKMAQEQSIDLDVFITEYGDDGVNLYATEKISQKAARRKTVFEKHGSEKKKSQTKNH